MISGSAGVWAAVLGYALQGGAPPGPPDERKINEAILRGVNYLRLVPPRGREAAMNPLELVLLAMVHAGLSERDPDFAALFQAMLRERPETTYRTALRAMVLEEVDRARHQLRIHECAQFLVDNQAQNGQWSYGERVFWSPPAEGRKEEAPAGGIPPPGLLVVFDDPSGNPRPPVVRKIPVRKQREGPPCGDNSNAQYAALGLRACHDAGILLPREVVVRAAQWWRQSQIGEAGTIRGGRVATGEGPRSRGWGYRGPNEEPYGSMTAGAVGALVICDYILGTDWKRDENVQGGLAWIRDKFSVAHNPGRGNLHLYFYYYLYALERAGRLYGTETFGTHAWYPEGAAVLLKEQRADGSWGDVVDTCFAILFLRRSTRSLVESRDPRSP